ncbi:hypothetical protein CHUAL_006526 [Chamberlinius hualienensis]
METQQRLLTRRSISPTRMALTQRGPMKFEEWRHSKNINDNNNEINNGSEKQSGNVKPQLNFDFDDRQRRGDAKSSNRIDPRLPINDRAADTNFDPDGKRRYEQPRNQQLKNYLKTLEKSAKTVDQMTAESPQLVTDNSQKLSVFSLSSDESFDLKSEPKKRVSYLKTNIAKEETPTESKPLLTNSGSNLRISDALLKAQQFSNKYKQLKSAQSAAVKKDEVKRVARKDEEPDSEEILKSSEDFEPSESDGEFSRKVYEQNQIDDVAKDELPAALDKHLSSSSTISSVKSLMNLKDVLLDLPSTSPESKVDEVKVESSVSEKFESDFEVNSESTSRTSDKVKSETPRQSTVSENRISRTNKTVTESKNSYASDFEEISDRDDESTLQSVNQVTSESVQQSELTLTSESSETESETVVSVPIAAPVKPPRKVAPVTLRHVKISTEDFKVPLQKNRSTQTMTNEEFNLHSFYNERMQVPSMLTRPVIYYIDPRVIAPSTTANTDINVVDDLLKQEMMNIRHTIESQRRNYVTAIGTLKPTYIYTTWKDTKKAIEKQLQRNNKNKQPSNNG